MESTTSCTFPVQTETGGIFYFPWHRHQTILTSLQEQGIEDACIEILKDIYTASSVTVGPTSAQRE